MSDENRIGDVTSTEKGSAARNCIGKANWSLMPLHQVAYIMETEVDPKVTLSRLTNQLGWFQSRGTWQDAYKFLVLAVQFLKEDMMVENLNNALCEVIAVWEHGQNKYAAFNWMKGMAWSEVINSAQRHIMWIQGGQKLDEESNRYHSAHIVCNAMMLCHYVDYYKEGNDLPTKWFQ
jgi:hypothetical protein